MYVMVKRSYGDFDMPFDEAVAVSDNKSTLEHEKKRLNAARKESDKVFGEYPYIYLIAENKVKVLY